jgi:hypothetical protein
VHAQSLQRTARLRMLRLARDAALTLKPEQTGGTAETQTQHKSSKASPWRTPTATFMRQQLEAPKTTQPIQRARADQRFLRSASSSRRTPHLTRLGCATPRRVQGKAEGVPRLEPRLRRSMAGQISTQIRGRNDKQKRYHIFLWELCTSTPTTGLSSACSI